MNDEALHGLAERLTGRPVASVEPVRGGGNNRLYRVTSAAGTYALKCYPDDVADARSRYEREFGALQFLWAAGERRVPEPLALDTERRAALYAWIDGRRLAAPDAGAVGELLAFARDLHGRRTAPGAAALPLAREAVLDPAELAAQLARRLQRLAAHAGDHPALGALLTDIEREVGRRAVAARPPLERSRQTLSPSDFGVHNALRGPAGLVFLDFEYFGWDDPVKLVADTLWHPGTALDAPLRQKFYAGAADSYGVDETFEQRFATDAPLYGLRWALIVLNEFLPAAWDRRVAAGGNADARTVRQGQLEKAAALLARVRTAAVIA